jgi:hypothetical protein
MNSFEPVYLKLLRFSELTERVKEAISGWRRATFAPGSAG